MRRPNAIVSGSFPASIAARLSAWGETSVGTRAGGSRFPLCRLRGPRVELGIVAENARLVERNAPVRGEIDAQIFLRRDRFRQGRERGIELARVCERVREGVSRAFPNLEQRQVDGREFVAHNVRRSRRVIAQDLLEIAEIFRDAVLKEGRGARLGFLLLVLEIEVGRDRVMRVVNLRDEIRDRKLQPGGEDAACFILWRESEFWAEIVENVSDV